MQWDYFHVLDTPYTLMHYKRNEEGDGDIYLGFCWEHKRAFAVDIKDENLQVADGHIWEAAWDEELDVPEADLRWFAEQVLQVEPGQYEVSWECQH